MITKSSAVTATPITEQSQRSVVVTASAPALEAESHRVAHQPIGDRVEGRDREDSGGDHPVYSAPSTRSVLVRTISAPMIEAMIAMPPMTSG